MKKLLILPAKLFLFIATPINEFFKQKNNIRVWFAKGLITIIIIVICTILLHL